MAKTARDIRAAVRERAAAELKAREDAVVKVAEVLDKRNQVLERLNAVEREARIAVTAALKSVALADLAELAGAEPSELRRLSRGQAAISTGPETPDLDTEIPASCLAAAATALANADELASTSGTPVTAG